METRRVTWWALGALLRVHALSTTEYATILVDELKVDHRAFALSLMFAATYN